MLEKHIEQCMCDAFHRRGAWPLKLEGTVAGLPDRLVVLPGGRVAWVELKTKTGRPSPLQVRIIRRLRDMGHDARIVYGLEQAMALVEELMPNEVHPE